MSTYTLRIFRNGKQAVVDAEEPRPVKVAGFSEWQFFSHRALHGAILGGYGVTECSTGLAVVLGMHTRGMAIREARIKLKRFGPQKFREMVTEVIASNYKKIMLS